MKNGPDTFDLLMRYLDGNLAADELRAVNDLLRRDGNARRWLLEISGQAVALGDLARSRTVAMAPDVRTPPAWNGLWPLAWAAALVLLAFAGLAGWRWHAARPVATLVEATGSIIWSGGRGEAKPDLAAGARLRQGTLETIGAVATAQLRFGDGTALTIGGNSEVDFAANGQKRVVLKSGSLSASVAKQPAGRPLIVRTATAEMEVLGTAFAVDAQADLTRLSVEEGRVRFRRLVDGTAVDVDARQDAVASLDVREPLAAGTSAMPSEAWRLDYTMPPGAGSRGEVRAADGETPARARGVPLVMGRRKDGSPVIHFGIAVRDHARPSAGSFVTLTADSRVTLRWRAARPTGLFVFLATQRPGGGFGGNFEFKLPRDAGVPDAGGWRTVSVPVGDFRPLLARRAAFAGNGVSVLMVTTYEEDAGLEVAGMGIGIPEAGANGMP